MSEAISVTIMQQQYNYSATTLQQQCNNSVSLTCPPGCQRRPMSVSVGPQERQTPHERVVTAPIPPPVCIVIFYTRVTHKHTHNRTRNDTLIAVVLCMTEIGHAVCSRILCGIFLRVSTIACVYVCMYCVCVWERERQSL
jgi:hypothetical protein